MHLQKVCQILANYELRLNLRKCHFVTVEVKLLEHMADDKGFRPEADRISEISNIKSPTRRIASIRGRVGLLS